MQEQPVTGAVTPPDNRFDERTLDPHTLRVVANTMRAEAAKTRDQARLVGGGLRHRNRLIGIIQALEHYAGYLDERALAVERGEGRPG